MQSHLNIINSECVWGAQVKLQKCYTKRNSIPGNVNTSHCYNAQVHVGNKFCVSK